MANKAVLAASGIGAVVVIGVIIYLLSLGITGGNSVSSQVDSKNNTTTSVASPPSSAPRMLLVLLQSAEDSSTAAAQYEANNTEPIRLAGNSHIRFDSPDYRTAESMRVIARDLQTGEIQLLRKSYDVNNEFFVNVGKGNYELQVQSSWFEKGSFVYGFDIMVV